MSISHHDVIIVGGSFAGLTVATKIHGRVLLLDRQPIGAGQASACAAPLVTLERVKACDAILQIHDTLIMHTHRGTATWRPGVPFATFDYRRFCQALPGSIHGLASPAIGSTQNSATPWIDS